MDKKIIERLISFIFDVQTNCFPGEEEKTSLLATLESELREPEKPISPYEGRTVYQAKDTISKSNKIMLKLTDEEIDQFFNNSPDNKVHPDRYRAEGAKWYRNKLNNRL
jgi:hypothetical protein